jgi:hypothetical protein
LFEFILDFLATRIGAILALLAILAFIGGLWLAVPLFVASDAFNYAYPQPVCGLYWKYPYQPRIDGSNTLRLTAIEKGTTFRIEEGNNLIGLGNPVLIRNYPTREETIEFHVYFSSLWSYPPESGLIRVTTSGACVGELRLGLNLWFVILRCIGGVIGVLAGLSTIARLVLDRRDQGVLH